MQVHDYHDSGSENQFRDKFSKVMNQLISTSKQPKSRYLCLSVCLSGWLSLYVYMHVCGLTMLYLFKLHIYGIHILIACSMYKFHHIIHAFNLMTNLDKLIWNYKAASHLSLCPLLRIILFSKCT